MKIIIGSRGSKLALWQAHFTRDVLVNAGYEVEIKVIKTKGDQIQHLGFDKIEGKGFFTKEIEDALLNKEIDLAVHSCKDMPTSSPAGLTIAGYSKRAAANDVILIRKDKVNDGLLMQLPARGVVGTSSARRKAQLRSFRPDIDLKDIRGNVGSRIKKLKQGEYDAILLAAAGIDRLGDELESLDGLKRIDLSPRMFVAAPAQGVLAFQTREDDDRMSEITDLLNDESSSRIAKTERQVLEAFDGGCQMPIGVYAEQKEDTLHMWISKSDAWNALPQRMHFRIKDDLTVEDVEQIHRGFEVDMVGSVFISTDLGEDDIFRREISAYDVELKYQPMIGFRPQDFKIGFKELLALNWLFFSSKNAAKYFFEKYPDIPENIQIAAINKGTAAALSRLGHAPHFIGEGGDMTAIAKAFDATRGENVIFPMASHSQRTIQKQLQNKFTHDIVVYDNFPLENIDEREESILVFTSPMNASNYFTNFALKEDQRVVAIGPSTAKAIVAFGWTCEAAYEPTKWALVDTVTRLLTTM